MNTFVVFFISACLVTLALADEAELNQQRKAAAEACKKELNAGDDVSSILTAKSVPSNEAQSCFLNCVYSKIGLIKDGKLNHESALEFAKAKFGNDKEKLDKVEAAFKQCEEEVAKASDEQCGRAKAARKCILEHSDDLQLFNKSS